MHNYSKNQLLQQDGKVVRVLAIVTDVLTIDCLKRTMPQWMSMDELHDWKTCDESVLPGINIQTVEELTQKTEDEMMRVRNLGKKSLKEVKDKIYELGLSFKSFE